MFRSMTLGRQIAAGVLLPYLFLLVSIIPYSYTNNLATTESNRRIAHAQDVLLQVSDLLNALLNAENAARGYALTGKEESLLPYRLAADSIDRKLSDLRRVTSDSAEHQQRIDAMQPAIRDVRRELAEIIDVRTSHGLPAAASRVSESAVFKSMAEIRRLGDALNTAEQDQLQQQKAAYDKAIKDGLRLTILSGPICFGVMLAAVLFIIRNLNRQIGGIVQHLRSSAAELQAAATQQVKGAKGQAATATEVATTMRELVTTSRQIADSAQRVTGVATETTTAARTGDHTVQGAHTSVEQVKHQVDRIVTHMLDLGKRSQEIGSILDIINELAEQTNILSINATIEAAGAGEAGRRFAVVADEIRKLADRVGGSTKEIRGLIEEVRAAANTTVMVTEDGSKAVDVSTRQFGEVAASFRRIVELVANTTQASREIELSTKQQTTAVEQASAAMADVAQTARDTEASSSQTMQTAAQLAALSQQLMRLVRTAVRDADGG